MVFGNEFDTGSQAMKTENLQRDLRAHNFDKRKPSEGLNKITIFFILKMTSSL